MKWKKSHLLRAHGCRELTKAFQINSSSVLLATTSSSKVGAFWYVDPNDRTADGYPNNFTRLPAAMVQTLDQAGPIWFGPSKQIVFNGVQLDPRDVIQFISPMQSFNSAGARAVETALRIEESRLRASQSVLPSGYLKQTGGEPLSSAELNDLAQQFNIARTSGNNTAALNEFIEYVPPTQPQTK
jgi:hypothetical protein